MSRQRSESSLKPLSIPSSSEGKRTRRKLDDALKTKVVLEALKEAEPLSVLASRYQVHPNQIGQWKKQFLSHAQVAFGADKSAEAELDRIRQERDEYARKVGELTMDVEFLKKNLRKLGML